MNYVMEQSQYQRELSKNQYRDFIKYIDDNYDEMYGNKISYTVRKDGDNFIVTLAQNSVIDFEDIFK